MANETTLPAAPAHLPESAKKQWRAGFAKAFELAKRDNPEDTNAQRSAATKSANAMLAIPEPKSAADIDALEEWQVMPKTRETRDVEGVSTRVCVTSDGRKYSFPVEDEVSTSKGKKN